MYLTLVFMEGKGVEKSHNLFTIPQLCLYIHLLYFRVEKKLSIDGKVFLH
jgi:hypothetical protein